MQSFKDKTGKEWSIELPIGTVMRIKSATNGRFDLFESSRPSGSDSAALPLSTLLASDIPTFWELLWYLIEPQANAANVTPEQFGIAMAGDCLIVAREVFFREWRDFFRLLQRPDQVLVLEKTSLWMAQALEKVRAKTNDPKLQELDKMVETEMDRNLNGLFGQMLESAESTLGRLRGDNST